MKWPFDPSVERNEVGKIRAAGFAAAVPGVVYNGSQLDGGIPLGALGTGYFTLEGTGKIGSMSIYNDIVPPRLLDQEWLALKVGQHVMPLSTADIAYWGHYPVADMVAEFRERGITVGIRAFCPFIPGNARWSNTPVALFELEMSNREKSNLDIELQLSFPVSEKEGATCCLTGAGTDGPAATQTTDGRGGATVRVQVAAGSSEVRRFAFAWYAPYWRDSGGEPHVHRYAQRFAGAGEVARFGLDRFDDLLQGTLAWQEEVYSSPRPDWLKDWLVQSLYSLAKNSVWIARTRKDEWWSEDGWFSHSESHTGCPITETMVCRMHGHFPLLFFFPELELTTLEAFKHFQISDGEIPFSYGLKTSLRDPRYHCQHPLNSGQFAQMVYRLYLRTGQKKVLAGLYDSAKRAIRYQHSLDDDDDGLVNDQAHTRPGELWPANQFYDIWPWFGTSAYVAGTWLATLKAGAAMAAEMDDQEFRTECDQWFARGLKAYERKLWNGSYYRLWNDEANGKTSDVCLANQLMAVWCARILGIDSPLPKDKVDAALDEIERLNMTATEYGLVNGVSPDGTPFVSTDMANDHSAQVFVGENLCAAMTFIYAGRDETGMEVARRLYTALFLESRAPWNNRCLISAETGLPVWGDDYYSDMGIWALPMALAGQDIAQVCGNNGLVATILDTGVAPGSKR